MTSGRQREALGLAAPFLLWGFGFVLLYAAHGLACSIGMQPLAARGLLMVLLAGVLAAQVRLAWVLWKRTGRAAPRHWRFIRICSLATAVAALGASAWTGMPVLFLSICS